MPIPRSKLHALLTKYGAHSSKSDIGHNVWLQSSSFTDVGDGLTASYHDQLSGRFNTLFTFQTMGQSERYSAFIGPMDLFIQSSMQKEIIEFTVQTVIKPLIDDLWTLDLNHLPHLFIRNRAGQSLPVKAGRRIWNIHVPATRTSGALWYNPRRSLLIVAPVASVEESPLISAFATIPAQGEESSNLDGAFSPDRSFTAEEIL